MQNMSILRQVKLVELLAGADEVSQAGDGKLPATKAIVSGLTAIESIVSSVAPPTSNLFAAGTDRPSIADLCLVPQVYNAKRFAVDLTAYPSIVAVVSRCECLASFIKAAPENQPDAVK